MGSSADPPIQSKPVPETGKERQPELAAGLLQAQHHISRHSVQSQRLRSDNSNPTKYSHFDVPVRRVEREHQEVVGAGKSFAVPLDGWRVRAP